MWLDERFEIAVLTDRQVGGVGVRGVIAKGVRWNLRGNIGWVPENKNNLREVSFFFPRPIMMNTAFERTYRVESSGVLKKASSLYVEKSLVFDYNARIMETWNLTEILTVKDKDHDEVLGEFLLVRE